MRPKGRNGNKTLEKQMKKKNPFGKSISIDKFMSGQQKPYALFKGTFAGWGEVTIAILKTYKLAENETNDPYARWFTAAKSDMTMGSWEFGDQYASEIKANHELVEASSEWREHYG